MRNNAENNKTGVIHISGIVIKRLFILLLSCLMLVDMLAGCAINDSMAEATKESVTPTATAAPTPTPTPTPTSTPTPTPVPTATTVPTPKPFGKPNLYMFILDEFSSFDMLSKYYDYDAKDFSDFLDLKGFNVIKESYSTDMQTEHSICDTLNMKYISRHYSKSKCLRAMYNAKLFKVLSKLGYSKVQCLSLFKGMPSINSKAGKKLLKSIIIDNGNTPETGASTTAPVVSSVPQNTGSTGTAVKASKLTEWGFYSSDYIRGTRKFKQSNLREHASAILSVFDYFENPLNYPKTTPRATFCYMTATHVPFTFNQYGGIISSGNMRNWRDKHIYLDQYKFMAKHLMATVSTIIANDPDSIIIIMSDHGVRYHGRDCSQNMKFVIPDKNSLRIMNAVYIKGQKYDDMQGLSAINTMRYIMRLYGLDYPAIKDPVTAKSPNCLKGIIPKSRHN